MRVAVERLTKTYRDRRGAELTALSHWLLAALERVVIPWRHT